jgi:hypothetical protein
MHTQELSPDDLLEAADLAERLLRAHKLGLVNQNDNDGNLKLLWVMHHMGYRFEHEHEHND